MTHHVELALMKGALLALCREVVTHHLPQLGEFSLRENFTGSPHSDTTSLNLRSVPWPVKDVTAAQEDLRVVDWPALQLDQRFRQVLLLLQEASGLMMARAMVVSLRSGGTIKAHRDEGLYSRVTERFHYPVFTNHYAVSTIGDESVHMPEGTLWWFNKDEVHSATNEGSEDRVHIIFDGWKE